MNAEMFIQVAHLIEDHALEYDQLRYTHRIAAGYGICNSPSCVAGWCASRNLEDNEILGMDGDILDAQSFVYKLSCETRSNQAFDIMHSYLAKWLYKSNPEKHWPMPYCKQWDDTWFVKNYAARKVMQSLITSQLLRDIASGKVHLWKHSNECHHNADKYVATIHDANVNQFRDVFIFNDELLCLHDLRGFELIPRTKPKYAAIKYLIRTGAI